MPVPPLPCPPAVPAVAFAPTAPPPAIKKCLSGILCGDVGLVPALLLSTSSSCRRAAHGSSNQPPFPAPAGGLVSSPSGLPASAAASCRECTSAGRISNGACWRWCWGRRGGAELGRPGGMSVLQASLTLLRVGRASGSPRCERRVTFWEGLDSVSRQDALPLSERSRVLWEDDHRMKPCARRQRYSLTPPWCFAVPVCATHPAARLRIQNSPAGPAV